MPAPYVPPDQGVFDPVTSRVIPFARPSTGLQVDRRKGRLLTVFLRSAQFIRGR